MYISKTTNQIKSTAQMEKCILRVNVLWMQSMRWPRCTPHGFNHLLRAWGPLARVKKLYKSPVDLSEWSCVSPVSQFCVLWTTLWFWHKQLHGTGGEFCLQNTFILKCSCSVCQTSQWFCVWFLRYLNEEVLTPSLLPSWCHLRS